MIKTKNLRYDPKIDKWIVDFGGRKRRRRKFFSSRDEAREFMRSEEFLSATGETTLPLGDVKPVTSSTSLDEAVAWYGKTISATKSKFSAKWEPMRLKEFADHFPGKQLSDIGFRELLEYRSDLLNKEKLLPQTVNRRLTLIKSFFKGCRSSGFISSNPALELENLPVPESPHVEIIGESDQKKLLKETKTWVRNPLWLAMVTGTRRNEIVNLRWGAVNLKEGYVLIERSEGFATKSKKSRRLPLTPAMVEMFSSLLFETRRQGKVGPNDFVFVTPTGKHITPDRLTREAKKVMRRVLKRESGAVHIWRHSALTLMLRKGADIETVRRIAGHSSLNVTQRYVHSDDVAMANAMAKLNVPPKFRQNVAVGGSGR